MERVRLIENAIILEEFEAGGHGNKWGAIYNNNFKMNELIPKLLKKSELLQDFLDSEECTKDKMVPAGVLRSMAKDKNSALKFIIAPAKYVNNEGNSGVLVSAYPIFYEGVEIRGEVDSIEIFPNALEARVKLNCANYPFDIDFFDSKFAQNRCKYIKNKEYNFVVSALVYSFNINKGREVLYKETKGVNKLYRLDLSRFSTYFIDEVFKDHFYFSGEVIEVKERFTNFFGERLHMVVIKIFDEMDFDPLILPLFISDKILMGKNIPKIGNIVEGYGWLQGYMKEEI
ncbi:MAG: hypothetical protein GXO02_05335 [Epsilonproteobacteria bacterium]|nr:hypothetical protein [Campylobacterota bacterium]